jgi:sulfite reductase alpha subunit-like flavoprotein
MAEGSKGQRHDRSALVLYGSETGNSQDVAEELGRVAERLHFVTRVSEMDLVDIVCPVISPTQGLPWADSSRMCY